MSEPVRAAALMTLLGVLAVACSGDGAGQGGTTPTPIPAPDAGGVSPTPTQPQPEPGVKPAPEPGPVCLDDGGCALGDRCDSGSCVPAPEPQRLSRTAKGCPAAETRESAGRALFEIPRAGEVTDDFFRLPFPSDLRRVASADGVTRVDLSELPRPAASVPPFDVVNRYLTAIEDEGTGFGLSPVVFFRFSRAPAVGQGAAVHGAEAVAFIDVTPG